MSGLEYVVMFVPIAIVIIFALILFLRIRKMDRKLRAELNTHPIDMIKQLALDAGFKVDEAAFELARRDYDKRAHKGMIGVIND